MIVYSRPPIDNWFGWQHPSDIFKVATYWAHKPSEWELLWAKAQTLARVAGWQGDIREGPYVTLLPPHPSEPCKCPVLIAWKQDHAGQTFVASPFELPWFSDHDGRAEG